ncbi:MAG: metallophosphoesterase family protein [Elusimicrobiales bacterium]|nr:metallophosphoesterase family protein [Elusimicrobiales bacterium]
MRYAIMSDLHGNYEALKAVLFYINSKGINNYIICGDIIGYGPQPIECINEIRNLKNIQIVMGNHDAVIAERIDVRWFNEYAKKSIEITNQMLTDEIKEWFKSLPLKIETKKYTTVHGSPKNPLKEYLLSEMQCNESLKFLNTDILFYGHTHIPMYFCISPEGKIEGDFIKPFAKIKIKECHKIFINPGSVGQPRDGNAMASFGIFDEENMMFELIRVNYDIKKVQEIMKKQGMHQLLIDRLEVGY